MGTVSVPKKGSPAKKAGGGSKGGRIRKKGKAALEMGGEGINRQESGEGASTEGMREMYAKKGKGEKAPPKK